MDVISHAVVFDCGALEDPTNGMVIVSDTVFNSMATYSCTTGYSLMGDAMRICLSNGLWSESEPICECKSMILFMCLCLLCIIVTYGWYSGPSFYEH